MWLGSFLALLGILLLIPLIIGIGIYVLISLGLLTLATNANIENPWLAWVPFGNLYILGKLLPELRISTYLIPRHELVLPAAALATCIFTNVPFIGILVSLANLVLVICAVYALFKRYAGENAMVYTVVGFITCGIMLSVFIYMIRNEKPRTT
jgi:hypothetical protein